jgi:cephalosporin hydroxylase
VDPLARGAALMRSAMYAILGARRAHRLTHPGRRVALTASDAEVIERFHILSYESGSLNDTHWLGVPILKSPQDCWVYQETLHELRPDLLIETGTYLGGSALFFAGIFDLLGGGRVVTIDDRERTSVRHPRITALVGDSVSEPILRQVRELTASARVVLVVLDSDHRAEHVLREMRSYAPFVTTGSYLVVEDTNVNGHPVHPGHGPGPMEAAQRFLAEDDSFTVDRSREKFLVSYFPNGWLRRTRPAH